MLTSIPVIKELIRWIRNEEMIEHLKQELTEVKAQRDIAQKQLIKYAAKSRGSKK